MSIQEDIQIEKNENVYEINEIGEDKGNICKKLRGCNNIVVGTLVLMHKWF